MLHCFYCEIDCALRCRTKDRSWCKYLHDFIIHQVFILHSHRVYISVYHASTYIHTRSIDLTKINLRINTLYRPIVTLTLIVMNGLSLKEEWMVLLISIVMFMVLEISHESIGYDLIIFVVCWMRMYLQYSMLIWKIMILNVHLTYTLPFTRFGFKTDYTLHVYVDIVVRLENLIDSTI